MPENTLQPIDSADFRLVMPTGLGENQARMGRIKIGRTLKIARNDAGLSQAELAEKIRARGGILEKTHPQTISDVERNVQWPSGELLTALCDILGITELPVGVTQSGLEGQDGNQVESGASTPSQKDTHRRAAESSAALIAPPAVTGPVTTPSDDVLTEDEKAMLTPFEQSVVRRLRQSSPHDRERIDQMIDVITGDVSGKTTGTAGDDALPRRFRTRTGS
jgi:transcriptional regulator with XRE-family HTH domain